MLNCFTISFTVVQCMYYIYIYNTYIERLKDIVTSDLSSEEIYIYKKIYMHHVNFLYIYISSDDKSDDNYIFLSFNVLYYVFQF